MKKSFHIKIGLIIITILILIIFLVGHAKHSHKYITLEEAYKENIDDPKDGLSNKRRFWNIEWAIPNTNQHYIVSIIDGKISSINKVRSIVLNDDRFIDFEKVKLTTSLALKKSIDQYNLRPGETWAKGYHFSVDNINNVITLKVIGLDASNNFTKISFDMETGEFKGDTHHSF